MKGEEFNKKLLPNKPEIQVLGWEYKLHLREQALRSHTYISGLVMTVFSVHTN